MTPKEKAKEIYCKYADALSIKDIQIISSPFAQKCALIAVNEIINSVDDEHVSDIFNNYWEDVKQEIEEIESK